jgi:hypothetical protein
VVDKDITEYVLGFLDGFSYRWLKLWTKERMISVGLNLRRHSAKSSFPENISNSQWTSILQLSKPALSVNPLLRGTKTRWGNLIPQPLKESSFRKGLDSDMRRKMQLFRELPFDDYKAKAESIDNDMKDTKTGPYAPKSASSSSGTSWSTVRSKKQREPASSTSTLSIAAASTTVSTASKKPTFSRSQKKEMGLCGAMQGRGTF